MFTCRVCTQLKDSALKVRQRNLCLPCKSKLASQWQKENPEKHLASVKKWEAANAARVKTVRNQLNKKYWEQNPEPIKARTKKYNTTEKGLARNRARRRARYARLLKATPAWVNEFFVSEAYDLAVRRSKLFGFAWNVDHIVPLKSERVCGLHVESNLQVIPQSVNFSKNNRHWPDMG